MLTIQLLCKHEGLLFLGHETLRIVTQSQCTHFSIHLCPYLLDKCLGFLIICND